MTSSRDSRRYSHRDERRSRYRSRSRSPRRDDSRSSHYRQSSESRHHSRRSPTSYSRSHQYDSTHRGHKREHEERVEERVEEHVDKKLKVEVETVEDKEAFQQRVEEQMKSINQENEEDEEKRIERARLRRQAILQKYSSDATKSPSDAQTATSPETVATASEPAPSEDKPITIPSPPQSIPSGSPSPAPETKPTQFADDGISMFDDMFACSPVSSPIADVSRPAEIETDAEGYCQIRIGDKIGGKYLIVGRCMGTGMFSKVFKAQDLETQQDVAIKVIRNNDMMKQVGLKEVELLKQLAQQDPEDNCCCVKYISHFIDREFMCIVFEFMAWNLRDLLKKFGPNGLALKAVQVYSRKLLLALAFLSKLGYLHADLKPDNILISESKTVLKVADFGSAFPAIENEPTPNLVTGFYRPPEVILGIPYGLPVDMWSAALCIWECATGKLLFRASSNNELLYNHLQINQCSRKLIKKGCFKDQYFNDNFDFLLEKTDPVTGRVYTQAIPLTQIPQRDLLPDLLGASTSGEDKKKFYELHDLLKKMLAIDPSKRPTPEEALQHPFFRPV